MAQEKWRNIQLLKDEDGLVPHAMLIIALHYHWQEVGGREHIHVLIDELHTHGAFDHYQECFQGGFQLVNEVEKIVNRLLECKQEQENVSKKLLRISYLVSVNLSDIESQVEEVEQTALLLNRLRDYREWAEKKLLDLRRFGSPDNFGRGLKGKIVMRP
jgi:hypothetical protein